MDLREDAAVEGDSSEEEDPPEGGSAPHMQDVPRLREEAADFAWDVAPLEQLGAVRAIASGSPAGGSEPSDHLQPLYEGLQVKLATGIRAELDDLLTRHRETFSEGDHDLGRTRTEVHRIPTGDARPVRLPPRRVPLAYQPEVEEQIQQYVEMGIAEECVSPWAAPLVLVRGRDGSNRICIDYRGLNAVTKKDTHPLPKTAESLEALRSASVYSSLDLARAYHQVEVHPEDRDKTAFVTGRGHHLRFVTMPFGLCNAPGTFQRLMERVLCGLLGRCVLVYLDDIIVYSRTPAEHVDHLGQVLQRIQEHGLKLRPKKCALFQEEVCHLGHIITPTGVAVDPNQVARVQGWEPPTDARQVKAFLGLAGYYRRYLPDYEKTVEPLARLTDIGRVFEWSPECQEAFLRLKKGLTEAPVLGYPQEEGRFILDTDASNEAIGAVLSQEQDGHERVLAYGSRVLSKEERNYCVTRKELLACVYFMRVYSHYLYGRHFLLRTDHAPLRWLLGRKDPRDQQARWMQRLSDFQYTVEHRPGKKHGNADALSRMPAGKCFRRRDCFHPGTDHPASRVAPGTQFGCEELRQGYESSGRPRLASPAEDEIEGE